MPHRFARVSLTALTLCIGCGDLAASFEMITQGPPTISLEEAQTTDRQWFVIESARVRTDVVGHSTYKHPRYQDEQRFVAPLVDSSSPDEYGELWIGCLSTTPDIEAGRVDCLDRMSTTAPTLTVGTDSIFKPALDDALQRNGLSPRDPRVLRVSRSANNEAWENLIAPAVLLLVVAVGGVLTYRKVRREAA